MCCLAFELLQYLSHEVSCGFYRQALCLLYTADAGLQDKPGVAMFQHEGEPKRQDQSFWFQVATVPWQGPNILLIISSS